MAPPIGDEPAVALDGTLYFPADYGQLRVRRPDGTWTHVGSKSMRPVTAIEWSSGTLLASLGDGALSRSTDDGATWTRAHQFEGQAVLDIDRADGGWIITTQDFEPAPGKMGATRRYTVYRARALDVSDLTLVRQFTHTGKFDLAWPALRPQSAPGVFYLGMGDHIERLDLVTNEWKRIGTPKPVTSFRVDSETGTLVGLHMGGLATKIFLSLDRGETWSLISRPGYPTWEVQFDNPRSGWATRSNGSGGMELHAYDAEGWKRVGIVPMSCNAMRVTPHQPVLCFYTSGKIMRQAGRDGWKTEFPVPEG